MDSGHRQPRSGSYPGGSHPQDHQLSAGRPEYLDVSLIGLPQIHQPWSWMERVLETISDELNPLFLTCSILLGDPPSLLTERDLLL